MQATLRLVGVVGAGAAFLSVAVHAGAPHAPAAEAETWRYGYRHTRTWDVPGILLQPLDVALADDGTIAVADGRRNAVRVHDARGNLVRSWDRNGYVAGCDPLVPFAVAIDSLHALVHVGWYCYSSGLIRQGYFYLESRPLGGAPALWFERVNVVGAADMDVHEPSGNLFVGGPRGIYRLNVRPGRVEQLDHRSFEPTGGAVRRITVLDDLHVALVRSNLQQVEIVSFAGEAVRSGFELDWVPLGIASDANGTLAILVRTEGSDRPPHPQESVVVVLADADGAVRTLTWR
jgi:hypothetical protein